MSGCNLFEPLFGCGEEVEHFASDLLGTLVVFFGFSGSVVEGFGIVVGDGQAQGRAGNEWTGPIGLRADHDRAKVAVGIGRVAIGF